MASLFDQSTRDLIAAAIESNIERIKTNRDLYTLYSGSIKDQLEKKILEDLGPKVYSRVKERLSPINLWKKIVDKLSGIYSTAPMRKVENGTDSDQVILDETVRILDFDHKMNKNNELFNCFGYSTLNIARNGDKPFVRTVPNHQFITLSLNPVDPTQVDVEVVYMNPIKDEHGENIDIFFVSSDDEFIIIDKKGDIQTDMMVAMEQDGVNPFGVLPYINWNDNEDETMSPIRYDDIDMTLLIPLLLSDLNYGLKFQIFSIIYGINLKLQNLEIGPDAFWDFQSDPESDKDPQIGTIKPEFDSEKVLEAIRNQVSIWLDSKGMKTGSIGSLTTENAASGVSKMVDLADVSEEHDQQATMYARKEEEFWSKYFTNFYPFWVKQGKIENLGTFSANAKVKVEFLPKTPLVNRGQLVEDLAKEVLAGFISIKKAIMKINPGMDEKEIDSLILEIEEEKPEEVISFGEQGNNSETEDTKPSE